ncbi:MAG TPA: acetylornithine deacetylase [Pyrinomonadaceae bacterium]|nr:acetylornithine deacetylase [Pyrinomonadaceae bacterium]
MTVEDTLAELIAIDSVSAHSNSAIVSYLAGRCERLGFQTQQFPHIDEKGVQKINLVALTSACDSSKQTQTEVCATELALVGHTDTVPYDPNWSEALALTERDGKLFGRGACDTKAFIAAALTAIDSLDLAKLTKPLALVFTSDEEIGCLGAKRLAEANSFTAQYAIVGEPTSLQPMRAGKGYCLAQVTLRGREAHSAYPQLGASAIFHAARLIERIESIAEKIKTYEHKDFDPPYTTLNVGLINGGSAKNIVPGECRFTLEWRTIPGQDSNHVLNLLSQAADDLQKQDADFICEIDAPRADDSFETPDNSRLVHFLEDASGKSSGTVAFGTEAPSMIKLGAEAVVFGPGDIRVAHRTGEFVPVDQLNQCVKILRTAIEKFCA